MLLFFSCGDVFGLKDSQNEVNEQYGCSFLCHDVQIYFLITSNFEKYLLAFPLRVKQWMMRKDLLFSFDCVL